MDDTVPFNVRSQDTFASTDEESTEDHINSARQRQTNIERRELVEQEKESTQTFLRILITLLGLIFLILLFYKKEYQFEGVKGKILTFSFLKISLTIFIFVSMVFSISFFIYVFKDIFFKIFRNDEIKHLCELNWHIATFIMIIAYVFIFYKNDFYILKSNFARLTIVQIFYIFALCIFFCGLAKLSILSLRRNYDFTNFHDRIKRFYLQSYFIKIIETDDLSILRQKIEGINKEPLVLSLYTPNLGFRGEEVKE
ncbi:hypothetical protein H311_01926, partial [Anncaliia algerae PRA109]